MARTKRSAKLESKTKRLALPVGKQSIETISSGCYLAYRRPLSGASGVWTARWYDRGTGKYQQSLLGSADDFLDANGVDVFTYDEAYEKAEVWFRDRARKAHQVATGEVISDKAFTVGDALDDYLEDGDRRGNSMETPRSYIERRIRPELGALEVGKLTRKRIEKWHLDLAASPPMKTGQAFSEYREKWDEAPTVDQLRARKSTSNRILAILKRALTLATQNGRHSGATPWRDVKPFKNVTGQRLRFLTAEEQKKLLAACPPDFQDLVAAALFTGSRYGPLCRLEVRDFDPKAKTIWISDDKGEGTKSRHIALSDPAVRWLKEKAKGKQPDDLFFQRAKVTRLTRVGRANAWEKDDQAQAMRKACQSAGIDLLCFHELRHTYASGLVRAGVPLAYVAKQLGHANTRMVEAHYAHLCPNALADSIRTLSPKVPVPKQARGRLKV